MQKKLIAMAIAGLASSGAFAQVTMYGILDASVYMNKASGNTTVNASNNTYGMLSNAISSSRLGVKGSEDVGGGMKANFTLETELALSNGAMGSGTSGSGNGTFSRAANLGLSGAFGAVALGRQATPMYGNLAASDVLGANSGGLLNAWVYSNLTTTANRITGVAAGGTNTNFNAGTAVALPNAYMQGVGYTSPSFSGLTVKFFTNWGNNNTGEEFNNNGVKDFSVGFDGMGVKAVVGQQRLNGHAGSTTSAATSFAYVKNEQKNTLVAGSYTMGKMKVGAAYVKTQWDIVATPDNAHDTRTISLGGKYGIGATTLGLSYTQTKDLEATGNKVGQIALLADYALSPRTSTYGILTRVKNDGAAKMNGLYTGNIAPQESTSGPADFANMTSVAVGIKHSF